VQATKDTIVHLSVEEEPVFWIALAITQWKLGGLLPEVKNKALEMMELGQDLERWADNQKLYKDRLRHLQKAKEMLFSPMPAEPKRKKPQPIFELPWQSGDVLTYKITRADIIYEEYLNSYILIHLINGLPLSEHMQQIQIAVYKWCSSEKPNLNTLNIGSLDFLILESNKKSGYSVTQNIVVEKKDINQHKMTVLCHNPDYKRKNKLLLLHQKTIRQLAELIPLTIILSKGLKPAQLRLLNLGIHRCCKPGLYVIQILRRKRSLTMQINMVLRTVKLTM